MSDHLGEPRPAPASGSRHLIPLAILAGCAMMALGIYFGLRAQGPGSVGRAEPEPAPDLSLPEDERGPWLATSSSSMPAAPAAGARGAVAPRPPAEVHTRSAFNTQWLKVRAEVNRTCQPTAQVKAKEGSWHIELPLTLQIAADGRIIGVRRFARLRDVAADGTHRAADSQDEAGDALWRCYASELAQRIRFAPARNSGELEVWVRILSTVE
ncbi:MAG: hypothetical protein AAF715_28570 [Myxococcota bacterium]